MRKLVLIQATFFITLAGAYAWFAGGFDATAMVAVGAAGGFMLGTAGMGPLMSRISARFIGGVQRQPERDFDRAGQAAVIAGLYALAATMDPDAAYVDRDSGRAVTVMRTKHLVYLTITELDGDLGGLSRVYPVGNGEAPKRPPMVYQVVDGGRRLPEAGNAPWATKSGAMVLSLQELIELLTVVRKAVAPR